MRSVQRAALQIRQVLKPIPVRIIHWQRLEDVALDGESEYPTQVDALGSGRCDASDELEWYAAAATEA
jgi:hypothetical protein